MKFAVQQGPKLLCDLDIDQRKRQTIPTWNSSGENEFYNIGHYVRSFLIYIRLPQIKKDNFSVAGTSHDGRLELFFYHAFIFFFWYIYLHHLICFPPFYNNAPRCERAYLLDFRKNEIQPSSVLAQLQRLARKYSWTAVSTPVYGRGITIRKHEIDSTDVASVLASNKYFFLEDETIIQGGRRCYPLKSLICPSLYPIKSDLSADIIFSDTGSLQGRAARLLNRPVRSNFAELLINGCSLTWSK